MQGVIFEMDVSNIKCEYLNGAYSELANLLGIEAVLKIHSAYRGQQITFPVQLFSKEFLKKQIVDGRRNKYPFFSQYQWVTGVTDPSTKKLKTRVTGVTQQTGSNKRLGRKR